MDGISDLMTREPITVLDDEPLGSAAQKMFRGRIRHLPVIDHQGHLVGLLTDRIVLSHGALIGDDTWMSYAESTPDNCGQAAVPFHVEVSSHEMLRPVLRRWMQSEQDAVVVLDEHRCPIGILTEHDLARASGFELSSELTTHDLPNHDVISVTPETSTAQALRAMLAHNIRHLTVLDDGALVGIVTPRDLWSQMGTPENSGPVSGAMTRQVHTVQSGSQLVAIARLIAKHKVGCVPILDAGEVVRVVTRRDLIHGILGAVDSSFPSVQ